MCNPMLIMAGTQAAGSLVQGYSSMQAGRAQSQISEAQAVAERDAAQQQADKLRLKTRRAAGAARAAYAGAGVAVDSATVLDATQDIEQRGFEDAYMALLTGERRARELRFQGRMARLAGQQAMAASVLRAGGQLAGGWMKMNTPGRTVDNYSPLYEGGDPFAGP